MKSTYSRNPNLKGFKREFVKNTRNGYDLIDVKYADGYWFGAYGKNIGYADTRTSDTTYFGTANYSDFTTEIEQYNRDGFELTDVEYADGYWLGVFANGLQGDATYVTGRGKEFGQKISKKEDLDYKLVDVEYADGSWFGVLNKTYGRSVDTFSKSYDQLTGQVVQQRKQGLELANLEYTDNGLWVGIFNDELSGLSRHSQERHVAVNDFETEIEEFRDQGYDLINVEFIDNSWFGIYKENTDGTDDIITPANRFDTPVDATIRQITIPTLLDSVFNP